MLHVLKGAGIAHDLSIIRNVVTPSAEFRNAVHRLGLHLAVEVSKVLPTKPVRIQTPLATAECEELSGGIVLLPVLRAGLGLLDAFLEILPTSEVGFVGMRRDEESLLPAHYFQRFPSTDEHSTIIVLDPMLATGGSMLATLELVRELPHVSLIAACVLGAQPGVEAVQKRWPQMPLYCAAIDQDLNTNGFISPGLGDAGDRMFGA